MSANKKQKNTSDAGRSDDSEPPSASTGKVPSPQAVKACRLRLRLRTTDCNPPLTGWLKEQMAVICLQAGVHKGEITLVIVNDQEMAQLHEQFTKVKGTTDVLTFDHRDNPRQPIESDLIICLDTAAREASLRKHDVRLEVLLYAVHGLNHLLGGDDHTEAGASAMHKWEDKMLTAAGFGAVFDKPATDAAAPVQLGPTIARPAKTKRRTQANVAAANQEKSGKKKKRSGRQGRYSKQMKKSSKTREIPGRGVVR